MTRRPKPLELPAVRVQLAHIVPMIRALLVRLEDMADDLDVDVGASLRDIPVREQKIVRVVPRHPTAVNHVEAGAGRRGVETAPSAAVVHVARAKDVDHAKKHTNGDGLPGGELTVLRYVAQHGAAGVTSAQLTTLTGFKKSYRDKVLRLLRARDLIVASDDAHVVTRAGVDHLGSSFKPLPTGSALKAHYFEVLPAGERALLVIACDRYPDAVPCDELTRITGFKKSYRDKCVRILAARKLLEKPRKGSVRAAHLLFDPGATVARGRPAG